MEKNSEKQIKAIINKSYDDNYYPFINAFDNFATIYCCDFNAFYTMDNEYCCELRVSDIKPLKVYCKKVLITKRHNGFISEILILI